MAGPVIDVIASLLPKATEREVSKKVSLVAAQYGLGASFGTEVIRSLYEKEGEAVETLARELDHPLVFTVTSNPQSTDAHEAFRELNPWRKGAKPSESSLLKFFKEFWNIEGIDGATFFLYEELSPSSPSIPRYKMSFSQFVDWMTRYYEIDTSRRNKGGAEGIFTVRKETSRLP